MSQKWYLTAMLVGASLLAFSATARAANTFDYTWLDVIVTEGTGVRYSEVSDDPIDPWFGQYYYEWELLEVSGHYDLGILGSGWWDLMQYVDEEDQSGSHTQYGTPPVEMINEHYEVEQYIGFPFYTTVGAQADIHAWIDADGYGWVEVSDVQMDVFDKVRIDLALHIDATHLLGDANLNGEVTPADYTAWADNYGTGSTWEQGDFNWDGDVTPADYTIWADHYNWTNAGAPTGSGPTAAPEPATMSLLGLGALALLRRRK